VQPRCAHIPRNSLKPADPLLFASRRLFHKRRPLLSRFENRPRKMVPCFLEYLASARTLTSGRYLIRFHSEPAFMSLSSAAVPSAIAVLIADSNRMPSAAAHSDTCAAVPSSISPPARLTSLPSFRRSPPLLPKSLCSLSNHSVNIAGQMAAMRGMLQFENLALRLVSISGRDFVPDKPFQPWLPRSASRRHSESPPGC